MTHVSAGLFFLISALTVLGTLAQSDRARDGAIIITICFLILEVKRIPKSQLIVGTCLAGVGIAVALYEGNLFDVLYVGFKKTLPFLLLFASVSWLQVPSSHSPSLLSIRETVLHQTPGRRFGVLIIVSHFLAATFNLASLSLLSPMLGRASSLQTKRRLVRAMAQGFGAATCWSPFFVGTVVVLSSVPGVSWIEVAPTGLGIALLFLAWGWINDRMLLSPKRHIMVADPSAPSAFIVSDVMKAASVLGCLFLSVAVFVEGLNWSIPTALAIAAPCFAILWSGLIFFKTEMHGPKFTIRTVLSGYSSLRGEVLLFSAANIFGASFSSFISNSTLDLAGWMEGSPYISIAVVISVYGFLCALGLHPIITVVLITSVITPEIMGISPLLFTIILMAMWGQGTNISPFSATILYLSRSVSQSIWVIAWRWNAFPVLANMVLLMGVAIIIHFSQVSFFKAMH